MPEDFITYLPSLIGTMQPIQYQSCFISDSSRDEEFARRLHEKLRGEKLRVWFAPEDMQGGQKFIEQIDRAIQVNDRLLRVLSEHSTGPSARRASEWLLPAFQPTQCASESLFRNDHSLARRANSPVMGCCFTMATEGHWP